MTSFLHLARSSLWRRLARGGEILLAAAVVFAAIQLGWITALKLAFFLIASLLFMHLEEPLPPLFDFLFVGSALLNAGGYAFHWFKRLGPYDAIVHGLTIFAITLSFGFLIYRERLYTFERKRWLFVVSVASFGITLGALWEIFEWSVDQLLGTRLAPSLADTITDMMLDTLGAVGAALLANWGLPAEIRQLRERKNGRS